MRTLVWCLVLVCALVAPRPAFAQKETGPPSLYLVATGVNNAIAERYLNTLCNLVKQEKGAGRYRAVAIYRTGESVDAVAQRLFSDPTTRESLDRKSLEDFGQVVLQDGNYCVGSREVAGKAKDADVVQVEWMADGAFRVQKAAMRSRKAPVLRPVEYVQLTKDANAVARALGVASFDLDLKAESEIAATWSAPPWAKCTVGGTGCILVGSRLDLAVSLQSSHWLRGKDAVVSVTPSCGKTAGDLELVGASGFATQKGYTRTFVFEAAHAGQCHLDVTLAYGDQRAQYRVEQPVELKQPDVAMFKFLGQWVVSDGGPIPYPMFSLKVLPFWSFDVNAFVGMLRREEGGTFLPASEVETLAREMTEELLALRLPIPNAASEPYAKRVRDYLASRKQRLGYELLQGERGEFSTLCRSAAREAIGKGALAATWLNACRRAVSKGRARLWTRSQKVVEAASLDKVRPLEKLLIRARSPEHISSFPKLASQPAIVWRRFPEYVGMPEGGREEYVLSGVSKEGQRQSLPTSLEIKGTRATAPSLDWHAGTAIGSAHYGGPRRLGLGPYAGLQAVIGEYGSLDFTFVDLFRLSGTNEDAARAMFGFGGSARVGYLTQLYTSLIKDGLPSNRTLMLDVGGGVFKTIDGPTQGYFRLQLGRGWTLSNRFSFTFSSGGWFTFADGPIFGTLSADLQIH